MAGNEWRSYDVLQNELLADDSLIGSVIEFYRIRLFYFTYLHYGIYVGRRLDSNGQQVAMIVHYFDPDRPPTNLFNKVFEFIRSVFAGTKAVVRKDRLERAASGKPCRINNMFDNKLRVFPNQLVDEVDENQLVDEVDEDVPNQLVDEVDEDVPRQLSIIGVARRAIGRGGYHLIFQNCESFATYCRYGLLLSMQASHPDTWAGWYTLKYHSYIVYNHPLIRWLANLEAKWSSVSPWWLHSRVIRKYEISLIAYLRQKEFETYKCSLSALLSHFVRAVAEEPQQPVPRDLQKEILAQAMVGKPLSMEGCWRLFVIILNESNRAEIWPNLEQLVIELFEIVFRESNRRWKVAYNWSRNRTLLDFNEFKQQFYNTEVLENDMLVKHFLPDPNLIHTLHRMRDND